MRIKTLIQGKRQELREWSLMSLHTNKYKQGIQEIKFDHLLNICHERIRGMVDGINIYTESSAGHHIHAVRSKHAAKREEKRMSVRPGWRQRWTRWLLDQRWWMFRDSSTKRKTRGRAGGGGHEDVEVLTDSNEDGKHQEGWMYGSS